MPKEVSSIRLLAIAYAKGNLSRNEYLQKRGAQLSALEFGQKQPSLDENGSLLELISRDAPFLQGMKVRYFDGHGALSALSRSVVSDHMLSDSERREYSSVNRLVILTGIILTMALFLQMFAYFASEQRERDINDALRSSLLAQTVDVARELNIQVEEEVQELTVEEYDALASELEVGRILKKMLDADLNQLTASDINQIIDLLISSTEQDLRVMVSTSWYNALVEKARLQVERLEGEMKGQQNLSSTQNKKLLAFKEKINAWLNFYAELAELHFEHGS